MKVVVVFDGYVEVEEQTEFSPAQDQEMIKSDQNDVNSLTERTEEAEEKIDDGKLLSDAINQNLSSFNPDIILDQMVKNFSLAKNMYGETMLRRISGYDPNYLKKNIQIPEFKKELKDKLTERVQKLKQDGLLNKDGGISEEGYDLASTVLYMEELDNIMPKGMFGEKIHKKASLYGDKNDSRIYKKGDRYKDISIKKTVRQAIRKKHSSLSSNDLVVLDRKSRGKLSIVYALDASGSMRGKKIEVCKKAGVALAYKAINEKDDVGLLVFGSEIKEKILPTNDFDTVLKAITKVRASMQTNIADTIWQSIDMFPRNETTKHLIILTDALPTFGEQPEEKTLEAVSAARNAGVVLSLVGINLDAPGEKFGRKIVEIGEGRFYVVRDLMELDKIILEDYYAML